MTVDQAHETGITDNSFSYMAQRDMSGKVSKHDRAPHATNADSDTVESVLFRADQLLMASAGDKFPELDQLKEPYPRNKLFARLKPNGNNLR